MPELSIALDKLGFIIAKAREYDAEVAPVNEDGGSNSTDDGQADVLEATNDNPTRQELMGALRDLNEDERIELLALAWMGRGDYAKGEWIAALDAARRSSTKHEAEYLAGTPLLADYLEEALEELGMASDDVKAEES